MDNLFHILNNSSFEYYFTLFFLVGFLWVIIAFSTLIFLARKYLPFNSKNCSIDINQKPEKSFLTGGKFGWLSFGRNFLELNFYNDFMLIKFNNRFIIVGYSEEIIIKDGVFFSSFSFRIDDLKYCITECPKEAIEYLKMKIEKAKN